MLSNGSEPLDVSADKRLTVVKLVGATAPLLSLGWLSSVMMRATCGSSSL